MKKTISLLLVFAMILSAFALTGCSKDNGEGEELTVSIVVSSAFGDKSFNDSAKEGADKLAQDYGVKIKTIECQEENFKQYMVQAAEESDIVVPVGWQFYEIPEVAKEYPDTKFIWVDNEAEGIADLPNVLCITYAQNEGSFLAGYIAAKMSKSGVVGAVGGDRTQPSTTLSSDTSRVLSMQTLISRWLPTMPIHMKTRPRAKNAH